MEEAYYSLDDVGYTPPQKKIAEVVIDTLGNSTEFNQDVIDWARRVGENYSMKMMREWYRANEHKLKAWNFKAVQPGAEPPERKRPAPAEAQAVPSRPPVSTPASVPGTRTQEDSGNKYAWIAALLFALCGGLVWLLRRPQA